MKRLKYNQLDENFFTPKDLNDYPNVEKIIAAVRDKGDEALKEFTRVVELQAALAYRVAKLQDALDHVRTLQGILPICMHCHKIRSDHESWDRIEKYIAEHTDARFSHSLCPECLRKHYPDLAGDGDGGTAE